MLEHENLRHGLELLRLERETQRAELDAEEARASRDQSRSNMLKLRAQKLRSDPHGSDNDAEIEEVESPRAPSGSFRDQREKIELAAKAREDDLSARFNARRPIEQREKKQVPKKKGKNSETAPPRATKPESKDPEEGESGGSQGLAVSTLRLVAQSAEDGSAQGIVKALAGVPTGEREKASHELCLAVGIEAEDWLPFGPEPRPLHPAAPRTAQALGMMSSGEWVKARSILAAVLRDDEQRSSAGMDLRDPVALFALALCDLRVAGSSVATEELRKLEGARIRLWPGPPHGGTPPTARSFPLGALVRACLESERASNAGAGSGAASDTQEEGGGDETGDDPSSDPRVRACSLAVSFLCAPANARKAGTVDGAAWEAMAEGVVKKHGKALSVALWGPEGGKRRDQSEEGKSGMTPAERIAAEWRKLRAQWGVASDAMEDMLQLSGLDSIKARFLNIARSAILDKERGYDPAERSYNIRLEGNPGTGEFRKKTA